MNIAATETVSLFEHLKFEFLLVRRVRPRFEGDVFDDAKELAAEYDVEITTEVQLGHPSRAIVNSADDFDSVVIGSHGGSLVDLLVVGNVAQKVFRNSPAPVIVAR